MLRALGLLVLLAVLGCESNEKKLERLGLDARMSELVAKQMEARLDSVVREKMLALPAGKVGTDSGAVELMRSIEAAAPGLSDSTKAARTKADLAQRALNKFMK